MSYRGRFAPSPTGDVHLGTARTALLAWLDARAAGGAFVMRLEALERLDAAGRLVRCTCSRKELAEAAARAPSAPHAGEDGPRYPGTCRTAAVHASLRAPALRFRVEPGVVVFDDARVGRVEQDVDATVGDFVVCRSDGTPAYQLAVVVDDDAMGITDVVRGQDLLGSTARQIQLFQALGRPAPRFAHVPLVVDELGVRLAKRHAAAFIGAQRAAGRGPETIVGELAASVGIHPAGQGPISAAELLAAAT